MKNKTLRLSVSLVALFLFGVSIGFWNWTQSVSSQSNSLLFTLKDSPKAQFGEAKSSIASVRESEIDISSESFSATKLDSFNIPLFDGKTYNALQNKSEGFERRNAESFTWRGKLVEGKYQGDVVLTFNKGFMTGLIYSPTAVYEIVTKREKQILVELDQTLFPECGGEIEPTIQDKGVEIRSFGGAEDSGDRIDVLVVYTEAVKNAVGGDTQAQTLAQNAIDASNTAYFNSKMRQRLRLVHSEQTALTESNSLSNLRADAETQRVRNTHKADIVAMLVNSLGGCGIGYVMTNVSTGFAGSAYSITRRSCAVGNLTFAHELGHNMGSTHNPKNGGNAAYPYSYGHYINGSYRSVMSYSAQCTSGCQRVPQFSNPAVIFNNEPTGLLETRDNVRSLENTSDFVANFRYSDSSLTLNNFSEGIFIPRHINKSLNWSSNNISGNVRIELSRDGGTTWETLIADTPNDGSETINVIGRPTKRIRIRLSSLTDSGVTDSSVKNLFLK